MNLDNKPNRKKKRGVFFQETQGIKLSTLGVKIIKTGRQIPPFFVQKSLTIAFLRLSLFCNVVTQVRGGRCLCTCIEE